MYHEKIIQHKSNENHRRFFNGPERDELAYQVEGKSGVQCEERILGSADKEKLEKGNFNGVPSLDTIYQVQCQSKKKSI